MIQRLWQGDECRLVKCLSCEGVHSDPFVGGDSEFYNLAYTYSFGYPTDKWEFSVTLEQIRTAKPGPAEPCLDMGAGQGSFLAQLIDAGFQASNLWAIEYSQRARDAIARLHRAIHLLGSADALEELAATMQGRFRYVFAFQVLEHLDQPSEFLRMLNRLLSANGTAFISVPNPRRIEFNESHGLLLDMPPNHVSRIGVPAMEALVASTGFRIEQIYNEPFVKASAAKEYLSYHYKRRAQQAGKLASVMEQVLPSVAAKSLGAAVALPSLMTSLPKRTDGASLLFKFGKA